MELSPNVPFVLILSVDVGVSMNQSEKREEGELSLFLRS